MKLKDYSICIQHEDVLFQKKITVFVKNRSSEEKMLKNIKRMISLSKYGISLYIKIILS